MFLMSLLLQIDSFLIERQSIRLDKIVDRAASCHKITQVHPQAISSV